MEHLEMKPTENINWISGVGIYENNCKYFL